MIHISIKKNNSISTKRMNYFMLVILVIIYLTLLVPTLTTVLITMTLEITGETIKISSLLTIGIGIRENRINTEVVGTTIVKIKAFQMMTRGAEIFLEKII